MSKTILVVADFGYVEGGAAKVALDSVRLLHKAGYRVILFCGSEKIDSSIEALGIRIEKLGMYQLKENPSKLNAMLTGIWNRKAAVRLKSLLDELDPEKTVVHIHTWTKILSASVFSALRKSGFRTVMTSHDYFLACPNGEFFDFRKKCICHRKGGGLSCLMCNCDSRNYVQKVWRWLRQQVVTWQVRAFKDIELIAISELNKQTLRKWLGVAFQCHRVNNPISLGKSDFVRLQDRDEFFFVGRMSADKGADLFAQTATECGVKGVMVGQGQDLDALKAKYPAVEFLGWVESSKVPGLLRDRAAVLVFPSRWYEAAGLIPLEAMAEGVPCIVSDATPAVEYIEDGTTGLLFKSGDVDDLKLKIERMKDPSFRARLSENIRQSFDISRWSEASHMESLKNIYDDNGQIQS